MSAKRWSKGGLAVMALTAGAGCSADDDAGGADAGAGASPLVERLAVGTACGAGASGMELTLQFMTGTSFGATGLRPTDAINVGGQSREFGELVGAESLTFGESRLEPLAGDAAAEAVTLGASTLTYTPTGGQPRAADDRLVVLLVDHSGSLKGQPDPLAPADRAKASDPTDARIDLLKNIVRRPTIPGDTYFSLIWFGGGQPTLGSEFGTPTRNRDVLVCPSGDDGVSCQQDAEMDGLTRLAANEAGGTPLADALKQTFDLLIDGEPARDLNPVVVLVTDGVEDGDTSLSGATVESEAARYAAHTFGGEPSAVPVVVVHLQPSAAAGFAQGPDPALHALACATGGEYFFIPDAAELATADDLAAQIAARFEGTWRLGIGADPAPTEPVWLETELTATVAGSTLTANPRLFASP
jgi:hypothetical protein